MEFSSRIYLENITLTLNTFPVTKRRILGRNKDTQRIHIGAEYLAPRHTQVDRLASIADETIRNRVQHRLL